MFGVLDSRLMTPGESIGQAKAGRSPRDLDIDRIGSAQLKRPLEQRDGFSGGTAPSVRVTEEYADERDSKRISSRLGPAQHEIPNRQGFSERPNPGQREQKIVRIC